MPIETILSALEAKGCQPKKSGKGFAARCPAHEDRNASLSVSEGDGGRVSVKCFAGCNFPAISEALSLAKSDFFPPEPAGRAANYSGEGRKGAARRASPAPRSKAHSKPSQGSRLTLAALASDKALPLPFLEGLGLCEVAKGVRIPYRLEDGSETTCRQRLRTALKAKEGSRWEVGDAPIVPYGLWRLGEAREAGRLILCEGESDAWSLWFHGFTALGLPGADMAGKLEAAHLAGIGRVYAVREPDKGGETFIRGLAARLAKLGFSGETFELSMPDGAKDPNELHKRHASEPETFKAKLKAALAHAPRLALEEMRPAAGQPPFAECEAYEEDAEGTWSKGQNRRLLANFRARICEDVLESDGSGEPKRSYRVEVHLGGQTRGVGPMTLDEFETCRWGQKVFGSSARLTPRSESYMVDAVRCFTIAQQTANETTHFKHCGWATHNGERVFLSASGALGANGLNSQCKVVLEGGLEHFALPAPPAKADLIGALRRLMDLPLVAPHSAVGWALLAAIGRALLGPCQTSLFIVGLTQSGKSTLAALAQMAFGPALTANRLPAAFQDTAKSVVQKLFLAKDVLLVVDDFVAKGTRQEFQEMQKTAETIFRAVGNGHGRGRLSERAELRSERPPRGLVVATGESLPHGESLVARLFVLELHKGEVELATLSAATQAAKSGAYALALSGLVQHLAAPGRLETELARIENVLSEERELASGMLSRAPDNLAQFITGLNLWARFAAALGLEDVEAWQERGLSALRQAAYKQNELANEQKPEEIFLACLQEAVESGHAYFTNLHDREPENSSAFGWSGGFPRGQTQLGFVDSANQTIYLIKRAALETARRLAEGSNSSLSVEVKSLGDSLKVAGKLAKCDTGRNDYQKQLPGKSKSRYWVLSFDTWNQTAPPRPEMVHTNKPVSFAALDAGVYCDPDGEAIEAGNGETMLAEACESFGMGA